MQIYTYRNMLKYKNSSWEMGKEAFQAIFSTH